MVERVWNSKAVAERYGCTLQCARNYMRKMNHMEDPLAVYERDLIEWERSRMVFRKGLKRALPPEEMIIPTTR